MIIPDPYKPEASSNNNMKAAIEEELVEGHKCASKLQLLLHNSSDDDAPTHHDLVLKILTSFSHSLSVLVASSSSSSNSTQKRPHLKDKRGCYKRKRSVPTWTVASPTPTPNDAYSWRKYGQKEILNSKHPRSYYRCTRKYDQGCGAVKQVQKMEDNSQMYRITYIGNHTCKHIAPQIIPDYSDMSEPQKNQDSLIWKDLIADDHVVSSKTSNLDLDSFISLKSSDYVYSDFLNQVSTYTD